MWKKSISVSVCVSLCLCLCLCVSLCDMICCYCHEWILLQRKQGLTQNREARSLVDGRGSCATSTPTLVVAAAGGAVAWVHNLRMIKWIDFCLILSELHRQSFSTQNCKSLPSFSTQNYQNPSFPQDSTLRIPSFLQDPKLQILSLSTQNCESLSSGPQKLHESLLQLPICNTWFVDCLLAASKEKGWIQPTNDNTCPIQSSSPSVIPNTWNHCVCLCLCVCVCVCGLFVRVRSAFHPFVFLCLRLLSWRAAASNPSQRYCFRLSREREEEENYSY